MAEPIYLSEELARDLAYVIGPGSLDGFTVEANRATGDSGRWMEYWELVIQPIDRTGPLHNCYRATYETGLTEYQQTRPFEGRGQVVFRPVRRTERQITVVEYHEVQG